MDANPDGSRGRSAPPRATRREDLRVLVIEDNPGDVELVQHYLAQGLEGVHLEPAESLAAARRVLSETDVDLILLDLGLPDADGLGSVSTVRRMAPHTPIIVLTGHNVPGGGVAAIQEDAQDYLIKDHLNASSLQRSISYAMERSRWQQQYRHQLSVNPDGMVVLDEMGDLLFVNSAAGEMLGDDALNEGTPEEIRQLTTAPADITLPTGLIVEGRAVDTDWQGEPARLIALRDITARREAERALSALTEQLKKTNERLEELVSTDPLTEVLNRRGVGEALAREVAHVRRTGDALVAILVDCDDFKGINDEHGYTVGDAALRALCRTVSESLRGGDHVARVGGDEFLVLLPNTSVAQGMAVAEKLRQAIKGTTIPVSDGDLQLSASLAVGEIPPEVASIEQVLATVNMALKRSKVSGKDRVSAFRSNGDRAVDAASDEVALDAEAIELGAVIQTIRSLGDEQIVGVEALTRGPSGFYAAPSDLFRAAAEQNTLTTLDLRALRGCLALLRDVHPDLPYHVNVFPSTVLNTPVDEMISLFGIEPDRLCLEISEQSFLGDPSYLRKPLAELRDLGVRLAIDDVGYGRSSIESLLVLEPEVVKIDRRCIDAITTQAGERRRLERLLNMLSTVASDVIVEGVETEEELTVLRDLGVNVGQGYYWDPPNEES